ncbi:MAG TPA: NAD(P)H-hydrate dehydratase [Actinomycetales bacterium]
MSDAGTVTPVTSGLLRGWPLPAAGGDKESRGRTLVIGGSAQTPGAVVLAAEAALRTGAGKLQVATVSSVSAAMAVAMPETLVRGLPQTPSGDIDASCADELAEMAQQCSAVLLGPGIMDVDAAIALAEALVPLLGTTLVLDALALAWLGQRRVDGLHHLDGRAVLTPNPKELALTLGVDVDEVDADPAAASLELARRTHAVVSCGGSLSHVAAPDGRLWSDDAGGSGLGVAGSGDVQAGIVTGLAARGADVAQAAVWAAHVHGRAGDRMTTDVGRLGFLARELPACIPRVLSEIEA